MLNLPRDKRSLLRTLTFSKNEHSPSRTNSTDSFAPLVATGASTTTKKGRATTYEACSTTTTASAKPTATMADTQKPMSKFLRRSNTSGPVGGLQTAFVMTTTPESTTKTPSASPTSARPRTPHTPTFSDLGTGRHSNKWLFDAESWRRILSPNRAERVHHCS